MNIFYLDCDLTKCAQYHCDKHVVKMVLESAQILCTVMHENGMRAPYKSTHVKHPCVIWAGLSLDNWLWLKAFALELNKEYQYRFDHQEPHKSALVIDALQSPPIAAGGITDRPQVMPAEYQVVGNPVAAYRQFYLGEKRRLLKYTRRSLPDWVV